MRHFLDLDQLSSTTLRTILDLAHKEKRTQEYSQKKALAGKTLAMVFEKNSTRTRVSFQVGIGQLGGQAVLLENSSSQMGRGESIADTARVLSRMADIIMIRTDKHDKLTQMATHSTLPVINALTDFSHPCQIMADLMTIEEHCGALDKQRVAWLGDGNNVATSFVHAAVKFGFELNVATPPSLTLPQTVTDWIARQEAHKITLCNDPEAALHNADVVVTDTWVSMGDEGDAAPRLEALSPFQVNATAMAKANKEAIFLHCLPAHRGEEVTAEVIDGPQSRVFDEAENRLHVQKAIMLWATKAAL